MSNHLDSYEIRYGKKTTRGIKGLFNSFRYAFSGFCHCIANERNMRIHLIATLTVLVFSPFYNFTKIQYAILFVVFSLVMGMEMVNTAIEGVCDYICPNYSNMARIVKDVVAGAVFLSSVAALIIGILFLGDTKVISSILTYMYDNPIVFGLFAGTMITSALFIKEF